jgi:hypothetical protein
MKEIVMKNRREILQWALNLLDHHYMHQADSSPPTAITVETEDMVKLVLFLTTDGFNITGVLKMKDDQKEELIYLLLMAGLVFLLMTSLYKLVEAT